MSLIDDVKLICDRLAPLGWRDLLLRVTRNRLDISQPNAAALQVALLAPIPDLDLTVAGFEDFSPGLPASGMAPGSFARSLLYHALASPLVHPFVAGNAPAPPASYPTLAELDTVENLICALQPFDLTAFLQENPEAVIAVFAYQYRAGARAAHRRYADMAYSRTGVARVGTVAPIYDPQVRSWRLNNGNGDTSLAAMPARYGAFLAVRRRPGTRDAVLEGTPADLQLRYFFPVRKVFEGTECFSAPGMDVSLTVLEYHRNEKLRRVHVAGNIPAMPIFDMDAPPFFRDSQNEPGLITTRAEGSSFIVVPRSGPLVRTSLQRLANGTLATARFVVPPLQLDAEGEPINRFATSLEIPAEGEDEYRIAPEYVNIRHEYRGEGTAPRDLNSLPGAQFVTKLDNGGYEAVHFIDDTCDGALLIRVSGIQNEIPAARQLPAFSLVTAPDFFPNADQAAISRWAATVGQHFLAGGPAPLSANQSDAAANLDILRPGTTRKAFVRDDRTMTHVTSTLEFPGTLLQPPEDGQQSDGAVSWLPDAASDVFAPGWDVSLSRSGNSPLYFSSNGLGSPFPEDAKLCAALNSFWPAVAPDASRTFGWLPTGIPLLDAELGHHPNSPAAAAGAPAGRGWDGEYGPFFEVVSGDMVINHAEIDRSDYVSNALANRIHSAGLERVNSHEMITRMETLRSCIRRLPPGNDSVPKSRLFLVTAEKVPDWSARPDRLVAQLDGPGYLMVFAAIDGNAQPDPADATRVRQPIAVATGSGEPVIHTCQLSIEGTKPVLMAWRTGSGQINSRTNP